MCFSFVYFVALLILFLPVPFPAHAIITQLLPRSPGAVTRIFDQNAVRIRTTVGAARPNVTPPLSLAFVTAVQTLNVVAATIWNLVSRFPVSAALA